MAVGLAFIPLVIARQIIGHVEPRDPLIVVYVALRGEFSGVIERADVDFDPGSEFATVTLPRQRRTTLAAEPTPHAGGRFMEPARARSEPNLIFLPSHQRDHGCAGVSTAAQAVTVND